MNRSLGQTRRNLEWLFLYVSQHDPRGTTDGGARINEPQFSPTAVCYRGVEKRSLLIQSTRIVHAEKTAIRVCGSCRGN